jgi:hypothetical protein
MMHSNVKNAHVLSDDALDQIFGGDGGAPNHSIAQSLKDYGSMWMAVGTVITGVGAVMATNPVTVSAAPIVAAGGVAIAAYGGLQYLEGAALATSGLLGASIPQGRVTVGADITEPGWNQM